MVVDNILHMNSGEGENSYAHNSVLQEKVIAKVRPILEDTIKFHYRSGTAFPKCFTIADLGCSSGPNTLFFIVQVLDIVVGFCRETEQPLPDEFQVFLNDLPGNDFNAVFKSLPSFYKKLNKKEREVGSCYIYGVAGSFYTRLFPSKSVHFAHSSYSLHWLSQVPKGIENNKENIYMSKTSPQNVFEAYLRQFQIDFSTFLCCRGLEVIPGGQMILTFIGRSIADPTSKDCCCLWDLLSKSLLDMATEGLVREDNIESFNLPYYNPYGEEVRDIVKKEGSFKLNKLETFQCNWDPNDDDGNDDDLIVAFDEKKRAGENVAHVIRAVTEPMLASHFGEAVMDGLFDRFANHVSQHLSMEKTKYVNIVMSLTRLKNLV